MQFIDEDLPNEEKNNIENMISFSTNSREYFTGESITGKVFLKLGQTITFDKIVIELLLSEYWRNERNVSDFKNTVLLSQDIQTNLIAKPKEAFILEQGEYQYEYQIDLPEDIQPTFEYPDGMNPCYHRYTLIVKLNSQVNPSKAERVILVKVKPKALEEEVLFNTSNILNVRSLGILPKGSSALTISYEKTHYKYGTSVQVKLDISNQGCSLRTDNLKLKVGRKIICGKNINKPMFKKTDTIYSVGIPVAIKLETKRIAHSALLREENLSNFNFNDVSKLYPTVKEWLMLMPTCKGECVSCEYYIKATLYFDKFVKHDERPRARIPFYVVHVSQEEINYKEQQNKRNHFNVNMMPPSNIMDMNQNMNGSNMNYMQTYNQMYCNNNDNSSYFMQNNMQSNVNNAFHRTQTYNTQAYNYPRFN